MDDDQLNSEIENASLPIKWVNSKPAKVGDAIKRTRQVKFLKAFATCGLINKACKMVGINYNTEHAWRSGKDPWYTEQFNIALQEYKELIEEEIHHRAIEGEEVAIIGKVQTEFGPEDRIIGHKRVKSDLLLMFQAKRHIPEFRDSHEAKKDVEKPTEAVSPIARISIRLDMISSRNQQVLPGVESNVIDVTPEPAND